MVAQSGIGKIRLLFEGTGAEVPVAGTTAAPIALGTQFKLVGDLAETDTGLVSVDKSNGLVRLSGNDEDGKGAAIATGVIFSPVLNGTLVCEARLEMQALTTRSVFVGFCGTIADDVAEPVTSTGTTLTLVASNLCGFIMDSQLTAASEWHGVYNGGTTTGATASGSVDLDVNAVAAERDILRVEIDPNGTARWYINGDLRQTVTTAVSTTALQGALVGCWGTTSTAADLDLEYFLVEANRDWTR